MRMLPPYQVNISPEIWGSKSVTKEYPSNCRYKIAIADPLLITVKDAVFSFQTFIGIDYFLELWSFSIKNEGGEVVMNVAQPFIALTISLKAVGRKSPDGRAIINKSYSLSYYPQGISNMFFPKGDSILVMIIPPLSFLHCIAVEHLNVRSMYHNLLFGGTEKIYLRDIPLQHSILRIVKMLEESREQAASLDLTIRVYILQALYHYNKQLRIITGLNKNPDPPRAGRIGQIIEYIHTHLSDENLNDTSRIAKTFQIRLTNMRREFKSVTGKTIQNYIRNARLSYAKRLLEETKFRVFEVGTMVGYSATSNFVRAYKKMYGHSPGEEK